MTILTMPSIPNSLKLIAQGYRKITSTSNNTNKSNQKVFYREWNTCVSYPFYSTFKVFILFLIFF
jgi:hypothetical protein